MSRSSRLLSAVLAAGMIASTPLAHAQRGGGAGVPDTPAMKLPPNPTFDQYKKDAAQEVDGREQLERLTLGIEILGVMEHRFLDGPVDVDMQAHLDEAGSEQVRAIMQEIDPDTILTFGPDGMTGHQGHKDVSRWTTEAFRTVAKPGARLFYATQTPGFVEEVVPSLEQFDIFMPGTPPVTAKADLGIDFSCDDEALELKITSLEAHESQMEGLLEVFGEEGLRRFLRDEAYREGPEGGR